jgi:glutamyl-tRNA synthetase
MPDSSSATHTYHVPPPIREGTREVRVRFSPSPTGSLHIGGAKTAMYDYLFAKGQAARQGIKGTFILRIEDTDQKRYVEGAVDGLIGGLRWLGLDWDEGPDAGGDYGPYVQSERTAIYQDAADWLLERGLAYRCFCSPERLAQVRADLQARGLPPGYDRHCRNLPQDEVDARVAAGETSVVRFRMPLDGETRFDDLLRGKIVYQNSTLEDLVLLKSDGFPTYHLANVVDDHAMEITHIFRGPEWIPTAPLHIQLYQAFEWEPPVLIHVPQILAPTGGKLSKRHGAASLIDFQERGYLPEALLNYLALLGWSLDGEREIFSMADLLEHFTVERMSASPSTFNREKLDWLNQQWINHHITVEDLAVRCLPFLIDAGTIEPGPADESHPRFKHVRDAAGLLKDRIRLLTEAPDLMSYFLNDPLPEYDAALLVPKKTEPAEAKRLLEAVAGVLPEVDLDDHDGTENRFRALADELGVKAGQLFMPIRVAATGRTQSPGLFDTLRVIGKDRVSARIAQAIAKL